MDSFKMLIRKMHTEDTVEFNKELVQDCLESGKCISIHLILGMFNWCIQNNEKQGAGMLLSILARLYDELTITRLEEQYGIARIR